MDGPGWMGSKAVETTGSRAGRAANQDRLAAAVRLRIAVALELVAGKVWALLDAVQLLVGSTAATARVHPEWVRRYGLARRCRFPRCWADSETRSQGPALVKDGKAGPRAGLSRPGQPR